MQNNFIGLINPNTDIPHVQIYKIVCVRYTIVFGNIDVPTSIPHLENQIRAVLSNDVPKVYGENETSVGSVSLHQ